MPTYDHYPCGWCGGRTTIPSRDRRRGEQTCHRCSGTGIEPGGPHCRYCGQPCGRQADWHEGCKPLHPVELHERVSTRCIDGCAQQAMCYEMDAGVESFCALGFEEMYED